MERQQYKYLLFLFIVLTFVIPLPQYFLVASSFMSGFLLFIMFFLVSYGLLGNFKIYAKYFNMIFLLGVFIFFHLLCSYILFPNVDFIRGVASIIVLQVSMFSAYFFAKLIIVVKDRYFNKIIDIIYYLFYLSFLGRFIPGIQNLNNVKPILPFNEPSHFALFYVPFLYYKVFISGQKEKIFHLFLGVILALILQNFTLLVGVGVCTMIYYRKKSVFWISLALFIMISYLDLSYFEARLNFTYRTDNLSVLVFMQGWEISYRSFIDTYGFGVGFQQLGYVPVYTEAGDSITRLLGRNFNETDAGLTFGKIVSELGIFGLIIIFYYLRYFIRFYNQFPKVVNSKVIFAMSIYFSFAIDIFIRGIGYFNTPFFLLFTSVFIMLHNSQHNENSIR